MIRLFVQFEFDMCGLLSIQRVWKSGSLHLVSELKVKREPWLWLGKDSSEIGLVIPKMSNSLEIRLLTLSNEFECIIYERIFVSD